MLYELEPRSTWHHTEAPARGQSQVLLPLICCSKQNAWHYNCKQHTVVHMHGNALVPSIEIMPEHSSCRAVLAGALSVA